MSDDALEITSAVSSSDALTRIAPAAAVDVDEAEVGDGDVDDVQDFLSHVICDIV